MRIQRGLIFCLLALGACNGELTTYGSMNADAGGSGERLAISARVDRQHEHQQGRAAHHLVITRADFALTPGRGRRSRRVLSRTLTLLFRADAASVRADDAPARSDPAAVASVIVTLVLTLTFSRRDGSQ